MFFMSVHSSGYGGIFQNAPNDPNPLYNFLPSSVGLELLICF